MHCMRMYNYHQYNHKSRSFEKDSDGQIFLCKAKVNKETDRKGAMKAYPDKHMRCFWIRTSYTIIIMISLSTLSSTTTKLLLLDILYTTSLNSDPWYCTCSKVILRMISWSTIRFSNWVEQNMTETVSNLHRLVVNYRYDFRIRFHCNCQIKVYCIVFGREGHRSTP